MSEATLVAPFSTSDATLVAPPAIAPVPSAARDDAVARRQHSTISNIQHLTCIREVRDCDGRITKEKGDQTMTSQVES